MLINDIFRLIYMRSSPAIPPTLALDNYARSDSDERQDVQQKTFTKWINHHLTKGKYEPIKNLFEDLRDGHKLLALLEVLTNKKYVSQHSMALNFEFAENVTKHLFIFIFPSLSSFLSRNFLPL